MPILILCSSCRTTMKFTFQRTPVCEACEARLAALNCSESEPLFEMPRQQYEIEEEP